MQLTKRSGLHLYGDIPMRYANVWILIGFFRLYELIWKRTIASQMADAQLDQTAADLSATADHLTMRANGSVIIFDGFMKIYREDRDDQEDKSADPQNRILPPLSRGQDMAVQRGSSRTAFYPATTTVH